MNAISTRVELFLLKSNKIISGKVPFLTKNLQKLKHFFIDLLVNTKGTAALLTSLERTYFFRRICTYRLRIRLRIPIAQEACLHVYVIMMFMFTIAPLYRWASHHAEQPCLALLTLSCSKAAGPFHELLLKFPVSFWLL